ncbi:effector-associated constant component EACC1 [Streptomyces inhibens]|uniref:effector-associated constant component EACC1 n=1 Tax=Streptomyces inhibens TaxID=2293571 RepID=UPI00402A7654
MPSDGGSHTRDGVELAVSDQSQLAALRDWMSSQPGVDVAVVTGTPGPGELGVLDVLVVLASTSGVVGAIRTLPDFIRSRRSGIRIETTVDGQPFVLDATNVDEVMPILERLLDD